MLTDDERERLHILNRKMNERPLSGEESAELGTLMAIDIGASREIKELESYSRRQERPQVRRKFKRRRRR